ncbi:LuxR C-terminal-related transcriptional regulator [Draconibacterium sp.]|nr:LuxR C-terminal-related transcriptional regulator [Draconibacterium sp.]
MWIENLSYIVTFIISGGIAVIGIMVSYSLYQINKKPVLALLLYQQIFLFSFFIYGIWGNMALRLIIGDLNISHELSAKLAFFIPIIGIPFLVVSWFMLIKFSLNLNGHKSTKGFVYSYFPTLVVAVFVLGVLIQKEIFLIPDDADLFIVRILVGLNLVAHLIFIFPFLNSKNRTPLLKEIGFERKRAILSLVGVTGYSVIMSFFNIFDYISTCIAIIILFGASVFIPVFIKLNFISSQSARNMNFNSFCELYEISKREAEIILEICSGKSNKAISEKLFITLQTVKDHNHHIYTKTGVKSRVQLANLVREKTGS